MKQFPAPKKVRRKKDKKLFLQFMINKLNKTIFYS